jgi:hypothetical protein
MLPNFIHIGAAKCASTWLWRVYQEHPEVYVPANLDNPNFFVGDYYRGLDWYEKTYFAEWSGEKAVGETSNSYLIHEPALERISRDLPGVRLTVTLRDPIERSYVHWVHMSRRNFRPEQHMDFGRVLGPYGWHLFRMWIEPSLYAFHLEKVFRHFPRDRVLINFYDDLEEDPGGFLRRFLEFLDVDPEFEPEVLRTVVGFPSPERPDPTGLLDRGCPEEMREELRPVFREDIERLEEITGRDLSSWR